MTKMSSTASYSMSIFILDANTRTQLFHALLRASWIYLYITSRRRIYLKTTDVIVKGSILKHRELSLNQSDIQQPLSVDVQKRS